MNQAVRYINNEILIQATKVRYTVASNAPNTEKDLFNSTSLVIWSDASDNTIYQDARVNWAFRALHDALHLKTRYDFSPHAEIALGRLQASKQSSDLLADLIYCEVSRQAEYYLKNGVFVPDQVLFTKQFIKGV